MRVNKLNGVFGYDLFATIKEINEFTGFASTAWVTTSDPQNILISWDRSAPNERNHH